MKISRILYFVLAALLVSSCSDSDESSYVYRVDFDNKDQAQSFLTDVSISCEKIGDCAESSGGLAFVEETQSFWSVHYSGGVCSQTLIAPNKILTNRHCLPDSALTKGANCKNITVFFPATTSKPMEKINCKSVSEISAKHSGSTTARPDWAVLELASNSSRVPVQLDTSGIPHETSIVAYPVYYTKSDITTSVRKAKFSVRGEIRKISCSSKMNSVFSNYYIHPLNPLFSLVCNYKVISGNSGSGIYSNNGSLLGVISMAAKKNATYEGMGTSQRLDNTFAGGTNAHCIEALNQQRSEACHFEAKNETKLVLGHILSLIFGHDTHVAEVEKYEENLAKELHVQWEDHNSQFMDQILKQGTAELIEKEMTKTVADFVLLQENRGRFPKTPKCISPAKKTDKEFQFYMPGFYAKYSDIVILPSTLLQVPLRTQKLVFKAYYDKNLDVFKAQLLRLDKSEQIQFKKNLDEIGEDFLTCLNSGFSWDCSRVRRLERENDDFYNSGELQGALYFNEDFINNNRLGAREVMIPVCE